MLRVTPLYGSRYDNKIASQESSCTLIEFGGVKILWNVGHRTDLSLVDYRLNNNNNNINNNSNDNNNNNNPLGIDLPEHDVLLISDSTLASCGALPLYYRQQQQQHLQSSSSSQLLPTQHSVKAYATFPTVKMGQMAMYDMHARISLDGGQPPFTLEELDASFGMLQAIKYAQIINIYSSAHNTITSTSSSALTIPASAAQSSSSSSSSSSTTPLLRITAHRAGHVVGGAFFCLQRVMDDTTVVLTTPRYHMAKELHLDSSTLLKYASTPDVLVCYPGGPAFSLLQHVYNQNNNNNNKNTNKSTTTAATTSSKTKKSSSSTPTATSSKSTFALNTTTTTSAAMPLVTQAQRSLIELVLAVVRRDGNVLLPVDASGRVWELLLVLHTHWERHRLSGAYHLVWIGPMVWNTWELGSSQLEWMASTLGNQFDSQRGHPLILQHVHKFISVTEMEQWLQRQSQSNMCVIASGADLEGGPARDLMLQWADNPDHAIIFTDSSQCVLRPAAVVAKAKAARGRVLLPVATPPAVVDKSDDVMGDVMDTTEPATPLATAAVTAVTTAPVVVTTTPVTATTSTTAAAAAAAAATTTGEEEGADGGALVGSAVIQLSPYCTAAQLLLKWCEAQAEGREMDDCVEVDVHVPRRIPLAGLELKAFLEKEEALRLEKKRLEEQRAMLREVELAKGQLRLGDVAGTVTNTITTTTTTTTTPTPSNITATTTSISGNDATATAVLADGTETATITSGSTNIATMARPKKKTKFDSSLFFKFSKPLYLTFEVREEAVGIGQSDSVAKYGIGESIGRSGEVLEDDYGIAVIPERFVDIVTGIDPGKLTGRIGEDRGSRGFGLAASVTPEPKSSRSADKGRGDAAGEDAILMDEQALEAADLSEGFGIIRGRNGRPPTKVMTVPRKVEVFCEISFVPLEGRVDARAARQSVRALQPRQVVILGGPKPEQAQQAIPHVIVKSDLAAIDEVTFLADAVRSFNRGGGNSNQDERVFTPSDEETAELSVGHAAYFVRLINTPFRRRDELDGDAPPEPVEPFEAQLGECTVSLLDCVATGQRVALDGSIVLAPRAESTTTGSWKDSQHKCLYLSDGDVLLTNLRAELIAQGMKADYSAHTGYAQLVVNGKIVVKKDQDSGRIHLEGPLTEDFFIVRTIVRGQYVTLQ